MRTCGASLNDIHQWCLWPQRVEFRHSTLPFERGDAQRNGSKNHGKSRSSKTSTAANHSTTNLPNEAGLKSWTTLNPKVSGEKFRGERQQGRRSSGPGVSAATQETRRIETLRFVVSGTAEKLQHAGDFGGYLPSLLQRPHRTRSIRGVATPRLAEGQLVKCMVRHS